MGTRPAATAATPNCIATDQSTRSIPFKGQSFHNHRGASDKVSIREGSQRRSVKEGIPKEA